MSFSTLQEDLEERVRDFIQDKYEWRLFVAENFENYRDQAVDAEITNRYRSLIDKYCAPGKAHQGLAFSSRVDDSPDNHHIVNFEATDDAAIVFTQVRHTADHKKGYIDPHEYEFKRVGDDWLLDEVYFNDGSGRYECL